MPVPWHGCKDQQVWWRAASWNLEDKLCVLQKAGVESDPRPLAEAEDHEPIPGRECGGIYTCEVWFCFGLIVTVPQFFPLELRQGSYCTFIGVLLSLLHRKQDKRSKRLTAPEPQLPVLFQILVLNNERRSFFFFQCPLIVGVRLFFQGPYA